MAIAIQQPAVVTTRDIMTSQELSDAISAPGSGPLMGPIRIEGSDLTSLERAKEITRDFITQALITSARKLLTNRSYGVSYHLCSG